MSWMKKHRLQSNKYTGLGCAICNLCDERSLCLHTFREWRIQAGIDIGKGLDSEGRYKAVSTKCTKLYRRRDLRKCIMFRTLCILYVRRDVPYSSWISYNVKKCQEIYKNGKSTRERYKDKC